VSPLSIALRRARTRASSPASGSLSAAAWAAPAGHVRVSHTRCLACIPVRHVYAKSVHVATCVRVLISVPSLHGACVSLQLEPAHPSMGEAPESFAGCQETAHLPDDHPVIRPCGVSALELEKPHAFWLVITQ
jgi:hypothetical protein